MKIGPIGRPETSVLNQPMLLDNLEDGRTEVGTSWDAFLSVEFDRRDAYTSEESVSSSSSSPLRIVFTLIYQKQTMSLDNTVHGTYNAVSSVKSFVLLR